MEKNTDSNLVCQSLSFTNLINKLERLFEVVNKDYFSMFYMKNTISAFLFRFRIVSLQLFTQFLSENYFKVNPTPFFFFSVVRMLA